MRAQVMDALAIVVLCPGAVFALAAGAIFSLAQGTALVWLGTSLGQTLAFVVGRRARLRARPCTAPARPPSPARCRQPAA
jgi:uncharacterized membrane protein YdjX (TVP38/TMEM64 family)